MDQKEVLKVLNDVGAIITDSHIVYTSGKHGSVYINKDALYPFTRQTSNLCHALASRFVGENIDTVIAPAIGGVILSQWVAYHLTQLDGRDVFGVYAEKVEDGTFRIRRGYDKFITHKNILVVEDIITTGSSVKKVIEAVRAIDGHIVIVGVLCNRGNVTAQDLQVPDLHSLLDFELKTWDEEKCPLCKRKIPINVGVGKGSEFLARQQGLK